MLSSNSINLLAEQSSGSIFDNHYIQLLAAGLIGFSANYTLEWTKRRRLSKKQLTWSTTIASQSVDLAPGMRERVSIHYGSRELERLTTINYSVRNTGNTLIKDHVLRFEFPEGLEVLELAPEPPPAPELEVEELQDISGIGRRFKIGHLEPNNKVDFLIVANGGNWEHWKAVSKNPDGDVEYAQKDSARIRQDQEHVRPFFVTLFLLFAVQAIFNGTVTFAPSLDGIIQTVITIPLIIAALPHLLPISRIVATLIGRALTRDGNASTLLSAYGGSTILFAPYAKDATITREPEQVPTKTISTAGETVEPRTNAEYDPIGGGYDGHRSDTD